MTCEEHEPGEAVNPYRSPSADLSAADDRAVQELGYELYSQVPWHRRDRTNKLAAIVGFFFFPPLLWLVCLNACAADIYCKPLDYEVRMRRWGWGNRLIVWLLALVQIAPFSLFLIRLAYAPVHGAAR
jgi:hypothetical protein